MSLEQLCSTRARAVLVLSLISVNVIFAAWNTVHILPVWPGKESSARKPSYTYNGDDYPVEYPIGALDAVGMTLHESVHFNVNLSDVASNLEWKSLIDHPNGSGRTRLGPNHQIFIVTFFHQMHCIWTLHSGLDEGTAVVAAHHVQHCLDYLRQTFLCEAADALEYGDFMERDFSKERVGGTLVCRDWEKVYQGLDEDWTKWKAWSSLWN